MKWNARLLVGVSLVAGFGHTAMSLVAAVWVMVLTGSSALAALAGFFVYAPVLAGPALGAVVDRLPVTRTLVATNLITAGLLFALLAVHSGRHVWLVFTVMLGCGLGLVLVDAAEARLVTAAFPSESLGGLNGARMSAQEASKLLAPLVGAGLFTAAGGPAVAAVAAGALVLSAGLYTLVRPRPNDSAKARRPLWSETVAGVRFLLASPVVLTPMLVASVAMLASGVGSASIYAVVDQTLHRPPAFVGVLSSVQGAGAIVGGVVVGRMLDRLGEPAVAAIGAVTFSLGPIAQAIGALPLVLAGSALVGIGLPWTVVAAMTAVQRHTPTAMVGRVAGAGTTLVFAPPALGIPLGALLVTVVDYRIPLAVAAASCAVVAAVALRAARRGQRRRAPRRNDCQDPSAYQPPSTDNAVPLTKPLRDGSARNATA